MIKKINIKFLPSCNLTYMLIINMRERAFQKLQNEPEEKKYLQTHFINIKQNNIIYVVLKKN